MAKYEIHTLERWETDAYYTVEAGSEQEAIEMVKSGLAEYDKHEHGIGEDEFIEVVSIGEA